MKKFLLPVIVIVVAVVAFVAGDRHGMREGPMDNHTEAMEKEMSGRQMAPGEEEVQVNAPFRCDNDSSFVAQFSPSMDEVTIASEGEETTIPMVTSTSGKVYENDGWTFTFKGETATVMDKKLKTTTTCKPPFDAENAPVNFGD